MHQFKPNRLIQSLLLTTLFLTGAQAASPEPQSPEGYETPPAAPQFATPPAKDFASDAGTSVSESNVAGVDVVETTRPLNGVSADTLDSARKLYRNLLRTLNASERHDEIEVHLGLRAADDTVDALYKPSAMRTLVQQSAIIREDLKREGKTIDSALWMPLQADLDTFRISLPAERYESVRSAAARGATAARAGDNAEANQALNEIEESLTRQYALMPLAKIRGDLNSARNALTPEPPYWHGVSEAMRSALESIHWVTTVQANGWISAFTSALAAREALPAHPDVARQQLRVTAEHLQGFAGARELADRARELSREDRPAADALDTLVDGITAHVSTVQQNQTPAKGG